jgi:hypothetical protein
MGRSICSLVPTRFGAADWKAQHVRVDRENQGIPAIFAMDCHPLLDAADRHKALFINRTGIRDVLRRSFNGADEESQHNCQRESCSDSQGILLVRGSNAVYERVNRLVSAHCNARNRYRSF